MTFITRRFLHGIARPSALRAIMLIQCMAVVAVILLCAHSIVEANGVDIDGFLNNFEKQRGDVNTYSARFVQEKTIALFDERKVSSGVILYKAPRQMLWKYETPDKTQMHMDGESVSFYFPDLEQIEVYGMEDNSGASHFFFAFEASADELKENFDITLGASGDEHVNMVQFRPTSEPTASQLQNITLWLRKSDYLPQRILIHELSGDSTKIELSEILVNRPLSDKELKFDAPEGTEIIKSGAGMF